MSYLKFDKNLMINLEQSLPKEILRTNQAGAYHCTSIVGCNTRKQHGLLVVPIGDEEYRPHVLLSSLDETVIQHGAPFNLGLHRYQGGVYSPNGHKYIREFNCDSVPRTTYRVGGVILTKEKKTSSRRRTVCSYATHLWTPTLPRRCSSVRSWPSARSTRCVWPTTASTPTSSRCPTAFPAASMKAIRPSTCSSTTSPNGSTPPDWYHNIEYVKDLERGVPYTEDLWVPGYFQVNIKKGESIIFSAGLSEANPRNLHKLYENEIASRTARTSFFNCLKNSAKQLYLKKR